MNISSFNDSYSQTTPIVSVIIPTFNRGEFIADTLKSIKEQTLTNWECIVVDDGSTDTTINIIEEFQRNDSRFILVRRPVERKKGGNTCRNIGIEQAKGKYIQFLDSDDLISSTKLEDQVKALDGKSPLAVATCRWSMFYNINNLNNKKVFRATYISTSDPLKLLEIFGNYNSTLFTHVYLIPRILLQKSGNWNEKLIINQDGEFFTRVLLNCTEVVFVSTAIAYYRKGNSGTVSSLHNKNRVLGMIESWQLIDLEMKSKYGFTNHTYVRHAKTSIYNKIKNEFPDIIEENKTFFSARRSAFESRVRKIWFRIALYIKKRYMY